MSDKILKSGKFEFSLELHAKKKMHGAKRAMHCFRPKAKQAKKLQFNYNLSQNELGKQVFAFDIQKLHHMCTTEGGRTFK